MSKKYLKNEKGIVRAITTENLQLEKPLLNEYYDINVHNRNSDKIDEAIKSVNDRIDNIELIASKVSIADEDNLYNATNVEDALKEVKIDISKIKNDVTDIELIARNVKMDNGTNVEYTVTKNSANILALQEELGTNKATLQSNINTIKGVL